MVEGGQQELYKSFRRLLQVPYPRAERPRLHFTRKRLFVPDSAAVVSVALGIRRLHPRIRKSWTLRTHLPPNGRGESKGEGAGQ